MSATASAVHGVLVVDKPRGPTSHDIVARARKLFGTREVGHAGTLDPMATGVLVLLFGEATKLSSYLTAQDKRYRAVVSFGRETDTLDAEGTTIAEAAVTPDSLSEDRLARAIEAERARREQVPPLFSAISIGGERAHRAGRRGESLELAARPVSVRALELIGVGPDSASLELDVSKGYYVRSLARDLGRALGLPAHLSELRRLSSGPFALSEAVAWPPDPVPALTPLCDAARRALPCAELTAEGERRARQGRVLAEADFVSPPAAEAVSAWLDPAGELVALGQQTEPGSFRVVRGFRNVSAR